MTSTATIPATQPAITIRGSAAIITEYLNYGINSILFQRGLYPPESFKSAQQYGITILMSTDKKIIEFLKNITEQCQEWITRNEVEKVSLIITNVHTKETLECWEFKVHQDDQESTKKNENSQNIDPKNPTSTKDMKRIQQEIGSVMRQISATVSYLPLLDCICSFDVLIHTIQDCNVPTEWNETKPVTIENQQAVQLRSFSTGIHKIDTIVNYKMTD